jgi:uncharacterized delta-60 repeat protein
MSRGGVRSTAARAIATIAVVLTIAAASCAPAFGAETMALLPDGKIALAGRAQPRFGALARLNGDGSLDSTFGDGGIVVDRRFSPFSALAVQPDGKIVAVASQGKEAEDRPVVARFLPDGSPDPSFGEEGAAHFPFRPAKGFAPAAVLIRPDGSIAVGGTILDDATSPTRAWVQVFGADGAALGSLGSAPPPPRTPGGINLTWTALTDLLPRPDGSLVMAGETSNPMQNDSMPLLARFVPGSGAPYDPAYGGTGLVRPLLVAGEDWSDERADAVAAAGDGLLMAGSAHGRLAVARFGADGVLDPAFGVAGTFAPQLGNDTGTKGSRYAEANALAVRPDGSAVFVGSNLNPEHPGSQGLPCEDCWESVIGAIRADGSRDASFRGGQIGRLFGGGLRRLSRGADIALLPDGRLLASGAEVEGRQSMLVSRYLPDGRLDRTFADAGTAVVTPCPGTKAQRRRAGCLPSARIRLRASGLAGGIPSLRFQVRPSLDWGRLSMLKLTLPPALETTMGSKAFATLVMIRSWRERIHMAEGEAWRHGLWGGWYYNAKQMTLIVPADCLRRTQGYSRAGPLVFRLAVRFEGAGWQRVEVRVSSGSPRSARKDG